MTDLSDTPPNIADGIGTLRVPPHSVLAEQHLLGSMLVDNEAWSVVGDIVSEADFYRHEHRLTYAAITALVLACKPADVVTVFEQLRGAGKHEEVGGLGYINALAQCVPSSRNAGRYAEIVREKALLRGIIAAADSAATLAWRDGGSVAEKLDTIAASFAQLERGRMRNAPRPIADLVVDAVDRVSAAHDGTGAAAWPTSIAPLDRLLSGGMRPGKVYGIAARPSVGKSSAARTIAIALAKPGRPTLLLSQEMPAEEVADCVLSQLGELDNEHLQTGKMDGDDWDRLAFAADTAARLDLYVDDDGGLTIADIRAKARAVKGLQVLVLDYLQLSNSTLKNATTNDQVAEISKGLKRLAIELGIAVVVLSQLNRDVERRADKEPQLSDLRDSGAIEQDLDVAVLLWTVKDDSETDPTRLVGWKVAKHRGGKKGRFGMRFQPNVYRWRESAEPLSAHHAPTGRGGFE